MIPLLLEKIPPVNQNFKSIEDALISYYTLHFFEKTKDITFEQLNGQESIIDSTVESITKELIESLRNFLSGNIIECYKKVTSLLYHKYTNLNFEYKVPPNATFFRMRNTSVGYLYQPQEMFHIPFELRRLVGNQRFSVSGTPSLYLGRSIYVCWEELNRPNIETANVAAFKTRRELTLLDLRMPSAINNINDACRIPFIVASSLKSKDPNSPFKPEYIISQAILHAILNNRKSKDLVKYDGIIYHSTKMGDRQNLFKDQALYENIVIPSGNTSRSEEYLYDSGYCPTICNQFEISDSISKTTFEITNSRQTNEAPTNNYSISILGNMEHHLNESTNWHKIMPHKFFISRPNELLQY